MLIEETGGRRDADLPATLIFREKLEGGDDRGREAVTGIPAFEFSEVGIEDAGPTADGKLIEEAWVQDMMDFITAVMTTDSPPRGIAADELANGRLVAKAAGNNERIASVGTVFLVSATGENLLDPLLGHGFSGRDGMSEIRDAAQTEGTVLADDTGDTTAPDVANAITHR